MNKYKVIYIGQGAGYNKGDIINIPKRFKNIEDITNQVNRKANLSFIDLGLLTGDINRMEFGVRMDSIIFETTVLIIEKKELAGKRLMETNN